MDIDSFLLYIKAYDIYKDIEVDIETRFDSSDYELVKPLPKGERQIRWKNHDKICCIKSENLQ